MKISPNVTKALSRSLLQLQKHSPALLTGAGIVGLIGAGVLAAKATLKLEETVDTGNARVEHAKLQVENEESTGSELTKAYAVNVFEIVKLYWLPITIAGGSTVLILSGHHILSKRNAALAVAYNGLQTAFSNYRERVRELYGEDVDRDIRFGVSSEKVVGEDGKKKAVETLNRDLTSDYIFSFGPENENFVGNHEHNMFFLTGHQNIFNDILRARGHLFLSEVLDGLGIERTPASIVTGWVYDPENKKGLNGDNYVEFNTQDKWDGHGYILLDFNVDGTIYDQI